MDPHHLPGSHQTASSRSPRNRVLASTRRGARDRLLSTARALFFDEGMRATGIDRVIKESEVAKATLYHHFATKEDLIVAVLETQLEDWAREAAESDEPHATPAARVMRLFDGLAGTVRGGTFRGCPFSNALTEFPSSPRVREVAARYRATQLDHVAGLVARDADDPLVRAIVMMLEGATNVTKITGTAEEILIARDTAAALLAAEGADRRPVARKRR